MGTSGFKRAAVPGAGVASAQAPSPGQQVAPPTAPGRGGVTAERKRGKAAVRSGSDFTPFEPDTGPPNRRRSGAGERAAPGLIAILDARGLLRFISPARSEERRVGK